jgi:hypothetical protein
MFGFELARIFLITSGNKLVSIDKKYLKKFRVSISDHLNNAFIEVNNLVKYSDS